MLDEVLFPTSLKMLDKTKQKKTQKKIEKCCLTRAEISRWTLALCFTTDVAVVWDLIKIRLCQM